MITFFNRKAIYIGYSKEERNKIIKLLTEHKIPYEKKDGMPEVDRPEAGEALDSYPNIRRPMKFTSGHRIMRNVSF